MPSRYTYAQWLDVLRDSLPGGTAETLARMLSDTDDDVDAAIAAEAAARTAAIAAGAVVEAYTDDFSAAMDSAWKVVEGNGSVVQAGDGTLVIDCPVGVNCDHWTGTANAPIIVRTPPLGLLNRCWYAEATLANVVADDGNYGAYLILYWETTKQLNLGGGGTSLVNEWTGIPIDADTASAAPNGTTVIHRYRMYYNSSAQPAVVQPAGTSAVTLLPGDFYGVWSEDDGVTWSGVDVQTALHIGTEGWSFGSGTNHGQQGFVPGIGMMAKSHTSDPHVVATFTGFTVQEATLV